GAMDRRQASGGAGRRRARFRGRGIRRRLLAPRLRGGLGDRRADLLRELALQVAQAGKRLSGPRIRASRGREPGTAAARLPESPRPASYVAALVPAAPMGAG